MRKSMSDDLKKQIQTMSSDTVLAAKLLADDIITIDDAAKGLPKEELAKLGAYARHAGDPTCEKTHALADRIDQILGRVDTHLDAIDQVLGTKTCS